MDGIVSLRRAGKVLSKVIIPERVRLLNKKCNFAGRSSNL